MNRALKVTICRTKDRTCRLHLATIFLQAAYSSSGGVQRPKILSGPHLASARAISPVPVFKGERYNEPQDHGAVSIFQWTHWGVLWPVSQMKCFE